MTSFVRGATGERRARGAPGKLCFVLFCCVVLCYVVLCRLCFVVVINLRDKDRWLNQQTSASTHSPRHPLTHRSPIVAPRARLRISASRSINKSTPVLQLPFPFSFSFPFPSPFPSSEQQLGIAFHPLHDESRTHDPSASIRPMAIILLL